MYRQTNERFNQNNNMNAMNPYLPHMQPNKIHMEPFNPSIPPPIFVDPNQNINSYQYPPSYALPPPNQGYERSYPPSGWREMSEQKGSLMPGNMLPPQPSIIHNVPNVNLPMHYEVRNMPAVSNDFQLKHPNQTYMISGGQAATQMSIPQRLSGIIKSQITVLQGIMRYTEKKSTQERQIKQKSRSRSREHRDRGSHRRDEQKPHREWNCKKCSFLNFDFRDRCKCCNQPKTKSSRVQRSQSSVVGGKSYVPCPDDWKCLKCSNINYARRIKCHRCSFPREK